MSTRRRPGPVAPARLRRAGAFAATSAALAWIAHGSAAGALPNWWLLLLGAAPVAVAAYPLLGGEATLPRIAAGLAAAQVVLHGWLSVTGGHHHGHHAGAVGGGLTGQMLMAHAVATAAAVVWLRCAEQRLWRAARAAWVRLILARRRWLAVPAAHRSPRMAIPPPVVKFMSLDLSVALGVRGPPLPVGP